MSIAAFPVAEAAVAQGAAKQATVVKSPRRRLTIAKRDLAAAPEAR